MDWHGVPSGSLAGLKAEGMETPTQKENEVNENAPEDIEPIQFAHGDVESTRSAVGSAWAAGAAARIAAVVAALAGPITAMTGTQKWRPADATVRHDIDGTTTITVRRR